MTQNGQKVTFRDVLAKRNVTPLTDYVINNLQVIKPPNDVLGGFCKSMSIPPLYKKVFENGRFMSQTSLVRQWRPFFPGKNQGESVDGKY